MTTDAVDRILREHTFLRKASDDPQLQALQTAIFIEDVFGVTLDDQQLGANLLHDPAAIRALVARSTSLV